MNVKDFEYLITLGQYKSITKAARELYISQPALSKFLQKVEAELGTLLFQRVGKELEPTYAGRYCLEKAAEILFLHSQIVSQCKDVANLLRGEIRLGVPMSRTASVISRVLPEFYKEFPHISVTLCEDSTASLLKRICTGELNLVYINYKEEEHITVLDYVPVAEEEMVLAAHKKFGLDEYAYKNEYSKFPFIPQNFWTDLPFIMLFQDLRSRHFVDAYFRKISLTPNVTMRIRNLGQAINAVNQGLGVTIMPAIPFPCPSEESKVSYYSLISDSQPYVYKMSLAYRSDAHLSKAETGLLDIMKNTLKQPAPQPFSLQER